MTGSKYINKITSIFLFITLTNDLFSQKLEAYSPNGVSVSQYERAANFFNNNGEQFTSGTIVNPKWVDQNHFWYRNQVFGGHVTSSNNSNIIQLTSSFTNGNEYK